MGIFNSGFISASLLALGLSAGAQTEDLNARDPRLKEGQMFVGKLIPADRKSGV